ncbi:MAG: ATP-binding cassette domain-containing protein [Bdellovibrionales bacterium]
MLIVTDLSYGYGAEPILDKLNVTLENGKITCLLGPSGCGKTTLLSLLAGALPLQEGRIESDAERPGPKMGHMTQACDLLPWLKAQDNACLAARLHPQIQQPDKKEVHEMFEAFGLKGYEKAFPDHLSGGQKQRLVLLRTLLSKPSLLLLDEPLGQLDASCRLSIARIVRRYVLRERAAALVATHQLDVAVLLADTILLLGERPARLLRSYSLTDAYSRKKTLDLLSRDLMHAFFSLSEEAA